MSEKDMIVLKGLKKYFSVTKGLLRKSTQNVKAVDDITLTIREGEIVGLVGESGSGKTTLARVLLGLAKKTDGEIIVNGADVSKVHGKELKALRKDVAVVFQDPASNLNPRQTVESSIMRPMLIHGVPRKEARKKAAEVLDMVKMDRRYLDSYPHQLSGGQLQRIAIARALALEPKVMVLDEPTSALDISVQAQILNLLLDLQEEMHLTYLIITHDLNVIRYISDKIAVMYLGRLVEYGSTEEISEHARHPYTRGLLNAAPVLDPRMRERKKEVMQGDPGSLIKVGEGCRFCERCKYADAKCRTTMPPNDCDENGHMTACFYPLDN